MDRRQSLKTMLVGALAVLVPWRAARAATPEYVPTVLPQTKPRYLYLPPGSCTVRCLTACKQGQLRHLVPCTFRGVPVEGIYDRAIFPTGFGTRGGYVLAVACEDIEAGAMGLFATHGVQQVASEFVEYIRKNRQASFDDLFKNC